jgi:hypothetical protein
MQEISIIPKKSPDFESLFASKSSLAILQPSQSVESQMPENANESKIPDLVIREPASNEVERALFLFQHLPPPPGASLQVAVRKRPVERLTAAAAGWLNGDRALFRIACLPGVDKSVVSAPMILSMEDWSRTRGAARLEYTDLLADENELGSILSTRGFYCVRSERFFEISTRSAFNRVMALAEKYKADVPIQWRTESIRAHSADTVASLVAKHSLLPLNELAHYWQPGCPFGFELDLSSILFDGLQPVGTLLWRRSPYAYIIDVRVVTVENPRLRAIGNLCLFLHAARMGNPDGEIRWLQFRGGENEHRETANLAIRMGGKELPPRRVFGKNLR